MTVLWCERIWPIVSLCFSSRFGQCIDAFYKLKLCMPQISIYIILITFEED